jgi:hypothetical protein
MQDQATSVFAGKMTEDDIRYLTGILIKGKTTRLTHDGGSGKRYVYISFYEPDQQLVVAMDKGGSIVINPYTPVNAFELVRGNIPLDVAEDLVVLFNRLAGSDEL